MDAPSAYGFEAEGVRFVLRRLVDGDPHVVLKRRRYNGPGYDSADVPWDTLDVFHLRDGQGLLDLGTVVREKIAEGAY